MEKGKKIYLTGRGTSHLNPDFSLEELEASLRRQSALDHDYYNNPTIIKEDPIIKNPYKTPWGDSTISPHSIEHLTANQTQSQGSPENNSSSDDDIVAVYDPTTDKLTVLPESEEKKGTRRR